MKCGQDESIFAPLQMTTATGLKAKIYGTPASRSAGHPGSKRALTKKPKTRKKLPKETKLKEPLGLENANTG